MGYSLFPLTLLKNHEQTLGNPHDRRMLWSSEAFRLAACLARSSVAPLTDIRNSDMMKPFGPPADNY